MDNTEKKIQQFVTKIQWRLRVQCLINDIGISVMVGIGICFLLSVLSCVVPFYLVYKVEGMILTIAVAGGAICGFCRTPDKEKAALLADQKGYQEKFSTAYALCGKNGTFVQLQKRDAEKQMQNFSVKAHFPIRFSAKRIGVLILLAIICLVSQCISTPARQKASAQHALVEEKKAEKEHLEKVEKKLEKQSNVGKKESEKLKKIFKLAKEQIDEAKSPEELQSINERLQKKLQSAGEQTENKSLKNLLAKEAEQQKKQGYDAKNQMTAQNETSNKNESTQSQGSTSGSNSQAQETQKNGENGERKDGENSGKGKMKGEKGTGKRKGGKGTGKGNGDGWNRGGKEGKQTKISKGEKITIPKGKKGKDKNLTGKADGNKKNSKYEKSQQSDAEAGEKVNYENVSATYKEKALQQTQQAQYPEEMKEKIKQYFEGLN